MFLVLLIIYLLLASYCSGEILVRFLPLGKKFSYLLGILMSLVFLALTANIFTAWLVLNNYTIWIAVVLAAGILAVIYGAIKNQPIKPKLLLISITDKSFSSYWWWIFAVAVLVGLVAVVSAVTGESLVSPWQVLPIYYVGIILILALILMRSIFSQAKASQIIIGLIFFSLLIHSYLLVYQNGFGGDRFRHLGSEERILQELEYQPTLLTNNLWWQNFGPFKVPQALVDSAKLSYGSMWSLEVIFSKATGISVFQINRFLLPILWSIFLPLLVYLLALLIWSNKQFALLAAFLSNGFHLWQYYGSQGLPASYGLLFLMLFLVFLVGWLRSTENKSLLVILPLLGLLYFSYSLAFLLALFLFVAVLLIKKYPQLLLIWSLISILILALLDYASSPTIHFSLRQIWEAWLVGNLFYFTSTAGLPSVVNLGLALIFFVLIGWWLWPILKKGGVWQLVVFYLVVVIVAYFLTWSMLIGEHFLSRRLTLFAVLPLILIIAHGLTNWAKTNIRIYSVILVVAVLVSASYFSGPVLNVAIADSDLDLAYEIWQTTNDKNICIEEKIEVILALEYISAKEFQETINSRNCQNKN